MQEIVINCECKLSYALKTYLRISFDSFQKLLRKKDIKVNDKRVKEDCMLSAGDKVIVYNFEQKQIEIVYEDDNICIANKPAGIEVCDGENQTLLQILQEQTLHKLFAVHRIDLNTKGLVIFAKDEKSKEELDSIIKNHQMNKFYLAEVFGHPKQKQATLEAFHKKDAKNALAIISNTAKPGFSKIITKYRVIEERENTSLLEVQILTGKTHQIRAHLAFVGFPLVGDNKYGSKQQNKLFHKNKQQLVAYKLQLTGLTGKLKYLNNKIFEISAKL